ncbi:MAG: BrnT family toxin [Helicobacteraceae bacterium]|nr:BrnT family toxin [Helicobacteraceae bacterium]
MKFEWDTKKDKSNIHKHKVSFEEAVYVFNDKYSLSSYDSEHSDNEDRYVLLGKSDTNLVLLVVHTFRDEDNIEIVRIISARKATKNEQKVYNERCPI